MPSGHGRGIMAGLNKNSDNEQTVYAPSAEYSTAEQLRKDMNIQRSQKAYPVGNAADPQMYSNQQQNMYANQPPQIPPEMYGAQPHPYTPPQNMYGSPTGYNNPVMQRVPVGYGAKKKKNNTAVIVLVVLILLLVCAIAGIIALIFLSDKEDDGSGNGTKEKTSALYDDEEKKPESNETETTKHLRRYSMPNVCGMNGDDAKKVLEDAGFIVELVKEHNSQPKDTVVYQNIPEETVVIEGTEIILNVSLGPETSQEPVVPTENQAPEYQKGRVVTKETDLNVRKGPDKVHDVIGTVAKGSIVEIAGTEGDWYKIVFKNGYGYVSMDYIELVN